MDSLYYNIKKLFKYIMKFDYKIIKDSDHYDMITIKYDNKELKCKYMILFTIKDEKILWSDENIYNDKKTRDLVGWLRNRILESDKNFNFDIVNDSSLKLIVGEIIKLDDEIKKIHNLNTFCILTENFKKYKLFYLITELIYF